MDNTNTTEVTTTEEKEPEVVELETKPIDALLPLFASNESAKLFLKRVNDALMGKKDKIVQIGTDDVQKTCQFITESGQAYVFNIPLDVFIKRMIAHHIMDDDWSEVKDMLAEIVAGEKTFNDKGRLVNIQPKKYKPNDFLLDTVMGISNHSLKEADLEAFIANLEKHHGTDAKLQYIVVKGVRWVQFQFSDNDNITVVQPLSLFFEGLIKSGFAQGLEQSEVFWKAALSGSFTAMADAYDKIVVDENTKFMTVNDIFDDTAENPINDTSVARMGEYVKSTKNMVQMMQAMWDEVRKDFNLTEDLMRKVYDYNEQHRDPKPENLPENDTSYDAFNGINKMTEEDAVAIFGEGHPIIGITHEITIDRIKESLQDFINYLSAMREYQMIDQNYRLLLEQQEESKMKELEFRAKVEKDPKKKAEMEKALDHYFSYKYLNYLSEPLDGTQIDRLVNAYGDEKKIAYWIQRSRDKLVQLKLNQSFILEISQFEKRFLQERYHELSNMLLLYFMQLIIYSNLDKKEDRSKVITFVMAMDGVIRKNMTKEGQQKVLNNVMNFLDQLIEVVYAKYYPDKTIIDKVVETTEDEKKGE